MADDIKSLYPSISFSDKVGEGSYFNNIAKEKLEISKIIVSKLNEGNVKLKKSTYNITSGEDYSIDTLLNVLNELDLSLKIVPKETK